MQRLGLSLQPCTTMLGHQAGGEISVNDEVIEAPMTSQRAVFQNIIW